MVFSTTPLQPTAPPFTPRIPLTNPHMSKRRRAFDSIAISRILERRGTARPSATTRAAPAVTNTSLQAQEMAPKPASNVAPTSSPTALRVFHDVNTPTPPVYGSTTSRPQTPQYVSTASKDAIASQLEATRKARILVRFSHIDPSSWQFQREMRRLERAGRFRQPRLAGSRNSQARNPYLNGLLATEWDEGMNELPWQCGPEFRNSPKGNDAEQLRNQYDGLAVSESHESFKKPPVLAATEQKNSLTARRGQQQLQIITGSEPTNAESFNNVTASESKNEYAALQHNELNEEFQAIVDDIFGPSLASNTSSSSTITPMALQDANTPAPFLHPGEPASIFDLRPAPKRHPKYTHASTEKEKFIAIHDPKNRTRDVLVNSTELPPIPFQQRGAGSQYAAVGGILKPVGIVVHTKPETGGILYEPQPEKLVGYGVRLGGKKGVGAGEVAVMRKASYAVCTRGALACGVCAGSYD